MVRGTDVLGGHLAYAANVQPTILGPLLIGKFTAGILGMLIAWLLTFRTVDKLEAEDRELALAESAAAAEADGALLQPSA